MNAPQQEIDYEKTAILLGIIGTVIAALRKGWQWVKRRVREEAELDQVRSDAAKFREDAAKFHATVEVAAKAAENLVRTMERVAIAEQDIQAISEFAHENREWMIDMHRLLDTVWSLDPTRQYPTLPEIPERRHRLRRKTDKEAE